MKSKILTVLFVLALFGCMEDTLDRSPLNMISDADLWQSDNLLNMYIIPLYSQLPIGMVRHGYTYEAHLTDESSHPYAGILIVNNYGNHPLVHNTGMFAWIRRANFFLEKIGDSNLSESEIKKLSAEVRFLRAYYYFDLAKKYGGMPIIDEVQYFDNNLDELMVTRNTEEELYDFILSELDKAIVDLPDSWDAANSNRATKMVAQALKSRAMLYAGSIAKYGTVQLNGLVGIPAAKAGFYFAESIKASQAIMESNRFGLYDLVYDPISKTGDPSENYRQIFRDKNNKEVIFQVAYNSDRRHMHDAYNMPQSFKPGCCGNASSPILEMVESYEYIDGSDGKLNYEGKEYDSPADLFANKDPRFEGTVMYSGSPFIGRPVQVYRGIYGTDGNLHESLGDDFPEYPSLRQVGRDGPTMLGDVGKTGFYILKYLENEFVVPEGYSTTNYIDFRYAEILLNYAEAALETGTNMDKGLNAINQVRDRAGIVLLSPEEFTVERLRNERKVELAFEDKRLWDIRRWRIGTELFRNTYVHGLWPYMVHKGDGEFTWIFKKHQGAPIDAGYSRVWAERDYYSNLSGYISTNSKIINNPGW
jgi:starch-binding outer membrane protein, SusD/RagB family